MLVEATPSSKQAVRLLAESSFDIILLDFNMPGCSGPELAAIIRQHDRHVGLPIVFMSSKDDVEALLINTGLGIDDFLVKPFTPEQLTAVVRSRARRASELSSIMMRDSFTGLLNHARFLEILGLQIAQVKREGKPASFAVLDLDHFKKINDSYGHAMGDQVIRSIARMLQQRLRRTDIVGRLGGEEFGIILPGCGRRRRTPSSRGCGAFRRLRLHHRQPVDLRNLQLRHRRIGKIRPRRPARRRRRRGALRRQEARPQPGRRCLRL